MFGAKKTTIDYFFTRKAKRREEVFYNGVYDFYQM
jgi:hypothetical protein